MILDYIFYFLSYFFLFHNKYEKQNQSKSRRSWENDRGVQDVQLEHNDGPDVLQKRGISDQVIHPAKFEENQKIFIKQFDQI